MIEINLIPNVKLELIKAQRTRTKVIAGSIAIGIISIVIVVLLALYVYGVQTVRNSLADSEIKKQASTLSKVEDLSKILTIQNQLTKITSLNESKKIDSRIFQMLQMIIPPSPNDVQLSTVIIDPEAGSISMDGQAKAGYPAVETFKKTILAAKIKFTDSERNTQNVVLADSSSISISNTSYGLDSDGNKVLRFTISFKYAAEMFDYASKNASVYIATSGNVTDSYLGVPQSIFVPRAESLEENN